MRVESKPAATTLWAMSSRIGCSRPAGIAQASGLLPTTGVLPPIGAIRLPAEVVEKPIMSCSSAMAA